MNHTGAYVMSVRKVTAWVPIQSQTTNKPKSASQILTVLFNMCRNRTLTELFRFASHLIIGLNINIYIYDLLYL